ncbi:cytochrome P450 71B34-like [Castanea sativa]|uniref:cytochrome P450 71B34-like n=1 Tax=Castanea sativa TaxID=21020 RepID=UPI003F6527D8
MALDTIPLWLPLLLVLPLLLLMKKKMDERSSKNLPPSPPKLPIIGNLHQLGVLPHQSMWQLSKKYGSIMLLQLSGITIVIISSADAAREVLKVHDLACCSRPPLACSKVFSYNYRDMAFSPYGDYWREIRKICVLELFSVKRVQSYQFIREEEVALFVDSISPYASSATPIDLSEKLFALTASITFRIGFGKSFRGSGLDNERFQAVIHEVMSMIGSYNASEFLPFVGWIIDTLSGRFKRLERVFHELDTLFQQVIDLHLDPERTKPEHEDIIDVLLRIEREQAESGDTARFTKQNIKAVLLNIFLGGIDTSAITMIWAMAELAKNPGLMKKAQDEVRSFIGNKGKVTESDTGHLHYLKMIVKETFRLHPPGTLLFPRETMSHFKINGYDIYPKMLVQVNAWAIGRDPKYWENPEEFIPERFMDNSIDYKGQNFELLTFGSGRRGCPGIYMATTTIELALANLLYCFNWKLPDGMKEEDINMEEAAGLSLTTSKKTALNLVPTALF